jgi:L-serine deaminase
MSEMREALNLQREALRALRESESRAAAWVDDQRHRLDKECLEPLAADGRRLQDAFQRASQEILAAERMVAG